MVTQLARKSARRVTWLLAAVGVSLVAIAFATFQWGLYRATVLIEQRDHAHALDWLNVTSSIWPKSACWHYLKARLERRLGNLDAALEELQAAQRLGWNRVDLKWEKDLIRVQTGQFNHMQSSWTELFSRSGSDAPEISQAYVNAALAQFRIPDAQTVLHAWQRDFPNDPTPWSIEGRIEEAYLNWEPAAKLHEHALELDPGDSETHLSLARCYANLGKQSDVIALLQGRAELQQSAEAWELLANAQLALEGPQASIDMLQQAPDSVRSTQSLLKLRARAALELGQVEAAHESLKPLLEKEVSDSEVHFLYGQALQRLGKSKQAVAYLEFAEEGSKQRARLGELHSRVLQEPDNVDLRFELAMIYYKYKSRDEGRQWLKHLLQSFPDYQPARDVLHAESD